MPELRDFNPVGAFQGARRNALGIKQQEQQRQVVAPPTVSQKVDPERGGIAGSVCGGCALAGAALGGSGGGEAGAGGFAETV